jgi:hypothetical protein
MRAELGYVDESDLDLVLMLDARTNGPLSAYLLQLVGLAPTGPISATRSTGRCAGSRETDVEFSWPGGGLLVEDKIDAGFTPGQAESYATEVAERRDAGEEVASVLICPERREAACRTLVKECFTVIVTTKKLASVARQYANETGDRLALAAEMVLLAAEESKVTGRAVDPSKSAWGDGYRAVLAQLLPEGAVLFVGAGSLRTVTATEANFPCAGIDPPAVWALLHAIDSGYVRMDLMLDAEPTALPLGARLVKLPRMHRLLIDVPTMTFARPAADQEAAVAAAVEAALILRNWASAAVT